MRTWTRPADGLRVAGACTALFTVVATGAGGGEDLATWPKWSPIEIPLEGPESRSRGEPNPFAISLDVTFTSPTGRRYRVPGFYDGDGRGGPDGEVWKVRFSADEPGRWTYLTSSPEARLDGQRGTFRVRDGPPDASGFWRWGRLEAVGTPENQVRYLKFHDGPYWLKAGCDDPENFLGRHRHYDTPAERKAAVDYLAGRGINSLYIMTHNIGGDDDDVWPWLGTTATEARKHGAAGNVRFDAAKLGEWRELFEHMQDRGVVPYLVLEDDSAWTGYDRDRYYREIIARFGDLPALVFNIGEENNENYPLAEGLALAERFRRLDPYGHPLGIHNVNQPHDAYIDSVYVDLTSIQTGSPGSRRSLDQALAHNRIARDWLARCRSRGRRMLVINFDEGRPELDRRAWWSAYLGGGVWEAHVLEPYDRPHAAWEPVWTELGGTWAFMESVPFWNMEPRNDLIEDGKAFCLAREGEVYALYLPSGGTVAIHLPADATWEAAWWNPASGRGGRFRDRTAIPGGLQRLTAPGGGDWALRIRKRQKRR